MQFDKITKRIEQLCDGLNMDFIEPAAIAKKVKMTGAERARMGGGQGEKKGRVGREEGADWEGGGRGLGGKDGTEAVWLGRIGAPRRDSVRWSFPFHFCGPSVLFKMALTTALRSMPCPIIRAPYQVVDGVFPGVTTAQLDNLAAETAAYKTTQHPDYALLAARIAMSNLHKQTKEVRGARERAHFSWSRG